MNLKKRQNDGTFYVHSIMNPTTKLAPSNATSVASRGQSGGITAYNVTVNTALTQSQPVVTRPWWKSIWMIVGGGVVYGAAAVTVLAYFHFQPKERLVSDDKKINVTSMNQSGGITAHTVNIGSQPRLLSDPQFRVLKAQILNDLPQTKPIGVFALWGDAEAYRFAAEILKFLKANGFQL